MSPPETPVCCNVCHKATATDLVKDHGHKVYPVCLTCRRTLQAQARFLFLPFTVLRNDLPTR